MGMTARRLPLVGAALLALALLATFVVLTSADAAFPGKPGWIAYDNDQVGSYETALDRLSEAAGQVDVVVPGHGAVAEGPEVAARLAADRVYIEALRHGEEPVDARLEDADWLSGPHRSNLEQARGR